MYEVDFFPSRFFIIEDALEHEELMKVLNTIKKDTENLVKVSSGKHGPAYKSNWAQSEAHGKLFKPIIKQINEKLAKDNISFELMIAPWYSEYREHDFHDPHIHVPNTSSFSALHTGGKYFQYSGIICLSDIGKTVFINPNSSSFYNVSMDIISEYNRVILFPSNVWHYVPPHGIRDRTRATFSFNCSLKMGV